MQIFPLPGRSRVKQFMILILCDGEVERVEGRDCSFPLHRSHTHYENREFAAETKGQEMGVNKERAPSRAVSVTVGCAAQTKVTLLVKRAG